MGKVVSKFCLINIALFHGINGCPFYDNQRIRIKSDNQLGIIMNKNNDDKLKCGVQINDAIFNIDINELIKVPTIFIEGEIHFMYEKSVYKLIEQNPTDKIGLENPGEYINELIDSKFYPSNVFGFENPYIHTVYRLMFSSNSNSVMDAIIDCTQEMFQSILDVILDDDIKRILIEGRKSGRLGTQLLSQLAAGMNIDQSDFLSHGDNQEIWDNIKMITTGTTEFDINKWKTYFNVPKYFGELTEKYAGIWDIIKKIMLDKMVPEMVDVLNSDELNKNEKFNYIITELFNGDLENKYANIDGEITPTGMNLITLRDVISSKNIVDQFKLDEGPDAQNIFIIIGYSHIMELKDIIQERLKLIDPDLSDRVTLSDILEMDPRWSDNEDQLKIVPLKEAQQIHKNYCQKTGKTN